MSDREIIIEMAADIKSVKNRPACPSPQCSNHENRLTRLETIIALVGGALVVMVPVLLWILSMVWGD